MVFTRYFYPKICFPSYRFDIFDNIWDISSAEFKIPWEERAAVNPTEAQCKLHLDPSKIEKYKIAKKSKIQKKCKNKNVGWVE